MTRSDGFGLPIGEPVPGWQPRPLPPSTPMVGNWCRVEPLAAAHGDGLFAAYDEDDGSMWTYLGYGPFPDHESFAAWLGTLYGSADPLFHAVVVAGEPSGIASYLRIQPGDGVIEIGHISLSPRLRRTTAATEALYLMMRRAFDELGYRRLEWKADALNAASAAAATRLGFTYEGTFRNATIYKGRNRDTAWYSIVDHEWPSIRAALERWLDPTNFGEDGTQLRSLRSLRAELR